MDEETHNEEHGPGCGCIFCAGSDRVCGTCGALIGGGCPDSTSEERRESLRAKRMEPWVVKVREISGQRVDWHYFGGRAVVKFIGDADEVRRAIELEAPRLIDLYREELVECDMASYVGSGRQIAQNNLGPDIIDARE